MYLNGKCIVIMGLLCGLGWVFVIFCVQNGVKVVFNGINVVVVVEVEGVIFKVGGEVMKVVGLVVEEEVVKFFVDMCVECFGGIDIIVYNVGIVCDCMFMKMMVEEWDDVIVVYLCGFFLCIKYVVFEMKEDGGYVVFIIFGFGLVGGFG